VKQYPAISGALLGFGLLLVMLSGIPIVSHLAMGAAAFLSGQAMFMAIKKTWQDAEVSRLEQALEFSRKRNEELLETVMDLQAMLD
jgi:hypothetical protein